MRELSTPDITLDVNRRNPGQFFACCGLLELAAARWPGSLGWFQWDRTRATFHVATASGEADPLSLLVTALLEEKPVVDLATDHDRHSPDRQPVVLREPFATRLDWWLDSYRGGDKSELKVWAGQQTPQRNFQNLQKAWREMASAAVGNAVGRDMLSKKWPMTGRFGFDPSSAPTGIDVGFSTDEQGIPVLTSPATEMLAAIDLQRCRPVRDEGSRGRWFVYEIWADPVEISVVPAMITGIGRVTEVHAFPVIMRNSQYGSFGWSKRWERTR